MKHFFKKTVSGILGFACLFGLFSCKKNEEKIIIVPSDGSNCTRALLLLQEEGYITLRDGVKASDNNLSDVDIVDKKGYTVKLVEAQTIPSQYKNAKTGTIAVINGNYALAANLKIADAKAKEKADGEAALLYANLVAVKEGNEETEKTKALVAALFSETVYNYIQNTYNGAVLPSFSENDYQTIPTASVANEEIKVGASSTPHAEILEQVKPLLQAQGYTLTIVTYDDYVLPNTALEDGTLDANYFQHEPYLVSFNAQKNTHLVSVAKIHYEPMALFVK
ncbi:MAG: MetQ/NlpA family ABC transporter substrate-binding protein [Candidatus Scatosoma sp.]